MGGEFKVKGGEKCKCVVVELKAGVGDKEDVVVK